MDILFASSRGSQYRYFKALTNKLPYDSGVTTFYPSAPSLKDLKHLNLQLLNKGIAFHVSRKKAKIGANWLPNWVWWLYKIKAYLRFSMIFLSFCNHFKKHKVEYVGIWNGHRLPEMAVKLAARELGGKVIFFENGLLPNSTTMDFTGVNDKNSLVRSAEFYVEYAQKYQSEKLLDVNIVPRTPHRNKKNKQKMTRPEGVKYLFVPFQVGFDSQVLINSTWINSMSKFFEVLEVAINRIINENLIIVVKEHPSDPKDFKEYYARHPRIYFSNEPTEELITNSEAVITINSSVGLESLTLKKKVIILGEACYKISSITQSASTVEGLVSVINGINDWKYDELALKGYVSYLSNVYLLRGAWQKQLKDPNDEHIRSFVNKMGESLGSNQRVGVASESHLLAP
ncbi:hypothetical protein NBRC116188_11080 [Oceaniserpentilla sp. 4NH20-0058]|uniref:capsular polysaccharide export protein, LipB/KpsS family n=1 Tax=Oceaniserpentilla sp. 4NH20-0058 TaxID=3127660 RepID=UPI003108B489